MIKLLKTFFAKGVIEIKRNSIIRVTVFAFLINFVLFALKMYIGLSANSISIYSDGINNLFDSLSGILSALCFFFFLKSKDLSSKSRSEKTEVFLSFILSVIVVAAGFSFLYNSAERLMYPTPVWFVLKYLWILIGTAVIKLFLFFFFKIKAKKLNSPTLKVITIDSLLDFFITTVTIISLAVSHRGSFGIDAYCGIVISIIILISGIKLSFSSGGKLLNFVKTSSRLRIEEILFQFGFSEENSEIEFSAGSETKAFLKSEIKLSEDELTSLKNKVFDETGIKLFYIS